MNDSDSVTIEIVLLVHRDTGVCIIDGKVGYTATELVRSWGMNWQHTGTIPITIPRGYTLPPQPVAVPAVVGEVRQA